MSMHHTPTTETKLETLSYPNAAMRLIEAVVGSTRRDALTIIRGASLDDWRIRTEPTQSFTITARDGEVTFQFAQELEAVHISLKGEATHIAGSCEMAQRLLRYAIRALDSTEGRMKRECFKAIKTILQGTTPSSILCSKHESRYWDSRQENGGYNRGPIESGEIQTSYGVVSLRSEMREYYLGHDFVPPVFSPPPRLYPYEGLGGSILGHSSSGGYGDGPYSMYARQILSPPFAYGEVDEATASFTHPHINKLRQMTKTPESNSEFTNLKRTEVRALLAWAKRNAPQDGQA